MDNKNNQRAGIRPSKRKLIQLYSALLYNAHLKGFIDGEIYQGKAKALCVPGLNCYSCPGAAGACPLGSLQNAIAVSGHRAGWYVLGILMLFGLSLGRTVCGWLCPFGLIQELAHKIPTFKIRKNRFTRILSYLKYVILAVSAAAIPLWYGLKENLAVPGFCKYICPAGTLEGAIGLLANPANASYYSMLNILFTRKFVIMVFIGTACIFCYRSFCRFICPLGAIYGMFNRLALVCVKTDASRCRGCGKCVINCKMDISHVGDHECISCAQCIKVCSQDALSLKAGKITLIAPEGGVRVDKPDSAKRRAQYQKAAWVAALAFLVAALIWFNFPGLAAKTGGNTDSTAAAAGDEDAGNGSGKTGTAVGDFLEDFTADLLDGSTFTLSENRGKVTIINMWATYCGPCVKELPAFEKLMADHRDDVSVLIVHAADPTEDVADFAAQNGIGIPCTVDLDGDYIFNLTGASPTLLPHTVVLDRDGRIIYNQSGSMTEELLNELYEKAR